jgi:hypothetical protein
MHRVTRQIVEVACFRLHRLAVDLEIELAFQDVIGFIPIVPMRRRTHSQRHFLLEQ